MTVTMKRTLMDAARLMVLREEGRQLNQKQIDEMAVSSGTRFRSLLSCRTMKRAAALG
jgi:hypothetical protein